MKYTAIVLIWLSTLFGGQGVEPSKQFPDPQPVKADVTFPTEDGCKELLRALKGPRVPEGSPERPLTRHIVLQDCEPEAR